MTSTKTLFCEACTGELLLCQRKNGNCVDSFAVQAVIRLLTIQTATNS